MTQTIAFGYDDAAEHLDGTFTMKIPEFSAIYTATKVAPDECILANKTCPIDQLEKLIQGHQKINDIYRGSGINPAYQSPAKTGTRIMTRLNEVGVVTDSTDTSYRRDVPLSGRLILEFGDDALITSDVLYTFLYRLVGTLWSSDGSAATQRLADMMRGGIDPI